LIVKENNFDMAVTFQQKDNEIIYKKLFIIKDGVVKASEMTKWNMFVKNLSDLYNQQITFSKS
jgi:hypothetical protein